MIIIKKIGKKSREWTDSFWMSTPVDAMDRFVKIDAPLQTKWEFYACIVHSSELTALSTPAALHALHAFNAWNVYCFDFHYQNVDQTDRIRAIRWNMLKRPRFNDFRLFESNEAYNEWWYNKWYGWAIWFHLHNADSVELRAPAYCTYPLCVCKVHNVDLSGMMNVDSDETL